MDANEQLTLKKLAEIIREGSRTAETRELTGWFLQQIADRLHDEVGDIPADVGTKARSDSGKIQFLDRAFFPLRPGWDTSHRVLPSLTVFVSPQELWWGVYAWGDEALVQGVYDVLQELELIEESDEAVVGSGGLSPVWAGGHHFALGNSLLPDELMAYTDITALISEIATDLLHWYRRLELYVVAIGEALGLPTSSDGTDFPITAEEAIEEMAHQTGRTLQKKVQAVHDFFTTVFPDPDYRLRCLNILADAIEEAHGVGESTWVITTPKNYDRIHLNVGVYQQLSFRKGRIGVRQDLGMVTEEMRSALKGRVTWGPGGNKAIASSGWATIVPEHFAEVWPQLYTPYMEHLRKAYQLAPTSPFRQHHSPEVVEYLRNTLGRSLLDPAYYAPSISLRRTREVDSDGNSPELEKVVDIVKCLHLTFTAKGFYFTPWQIATFFTALQTKGFVILSGISGTGKSKLAQHFARAFPQPIVRARTQYADAVNITVKPYMLKYKRFIIPKSALPLYDPPPLGETKEVLIRYDGKSNHCTMAHGTSGGGNYVVLYLRADAGKWFKSSFAEEDVILVEPSWDEKDHFVGFHLYTEEGYQAQRASTFEEGQNWHFTSVRPDWRDSKSLLGYYNPLTGSYEWTPFLHFLLHATRSYRKGENLPWFVILDEMNLAHVEYYFADLLSVLESGRDEEGWTREALQLVYPDEATGDLPPREIKIPPNLYIVGTVNVDETTHAFSPKVQDRAFTMELTEADFSNYPPAGVDGGYNLSKVNKHALLEAFSRGSRYACIEKEAVAAYVADNPEVRQRLQRLNEQLRPYGLHFGYRVFDEIVAFLANAQDSGVYESVIVEDAGARFTGLDETDLAFDAAVLMKILPKFHGSRGQLEQPLMKLLAWALNPDSPDKSLSDVDVTQVELLRSLPYRFPYTAERLQRMLQILYITGFAT